MNIKLGDEVRDQVTGFIGIVVCRYEYLNGCDRFSLQPKVDKDGILPAPETFDEPQLKAVVKKKVKQGSKLTGGPERYMPKARPKGMRNE